MWEERLTQAAPGDGHASCPMPLPQTSRAEIRVSPAALSTPSLSSICFLGTLSLGIVEISFPQEEDSSVARSPTSLSGGVALSPCPPPPFSEDEWKAGNQAWSEGWLGHI